MAPAFLEHASVDADKTHRVKWTRNDLPALEDSGLFDFRRVELIEGDLIDKSGQKPAHIDGAKACILRMVDLFQMGFRALREPDRRGAAGQLAQ